MKRERLTMAQALVKFLDNQYIECDGVETKFVSGIFGIFGGTLIFFRIIQAQEQSRDYQHCSCCNKQYPEFIHLLFSSVKKRPERALLLRLLQAVLPATRAVLSEEAWVL